MSIQAIDTGTTLIYVPDSIAAQFYALVCCTVIRMYMKIADMVPDPRSENCNPIWSM